MEREHYIMCEELDPERFYGETSTILGLQQTLNPTCAEKTEKETQAGNRKMTESLPAQEQ